MITYIFDTIFTKKLFISIKSYYYFDLKESLMMIDIQFWQFDSKKPGHIIGAFNTHVSKLLKHCMSNKSELPIK